MREGAVSRGLWPPWGARNSPQVQSARKQGPRYNFKELHSASNPNGQKTDSPLKLEVSERNAAADLWISAMPAGLPTCRCEAICASSNGEFVVLCYENKYNNKKTLSLLIFKNFLSELPPNLRPSSLFSGFYSHITLKVYFSGVFYLLFSFSWKFDPFFFIYQLKLSYQHIFWQFLILWLFCLFLP